mgnify:FL=1|tara:strand:- start:7028 stop:8587 length:1560 start_codon:yes stop_codon:yes gene_type:complete
MKKLILYVLIILSFQMYSQTENLKSDFTFKELHNKIRLNYILVDMPTDKVNYQLQSKMSLIGLNYNIPITDWLYTGAGMHAAITGDQGGLFTLGVNLGVNTKIYKNLYFDANVHFGGGGGFRTLVNGGGILYPNIGLQYKKNNYSFGVQYGQVNFFTGIIKNDNISFFLEIPSVLRYKSYLEAQKEFTLENSIKDKVWKKPAVKSVQQVTFDFFFPIGDSRKDSSQNFDPINNTLSILGFEYQRYLTENTFVYVHTDAMYKGLVAGFMDLFFGVGKNLEVTKHINLFGKFGVGAAGGRIFPENGLTMYPSIGADFKITDKFGLSTHGGYHRSIGGTFEAYTAGFSIKYYGLSGGVSDPFTEEKATKIKTQGMQVSVQNQTYYDVAKFGIPDSDLNLIAIKIIYDISKRFYVAGEASFAYEGRSGGYAHGLFGLGIRSNRFLHNKFSTFFEMGVGVAGGGRVDSGEGILVRPTAGINYHINNDFAVNIAGGQMVSPYGNVNSTNINIGLTYGFSILNARK